MGLIDAAQAELRFLPPYSPAQNPIENLWNKVKTFLRADKTRRQEELYDAIAAASETVTPKDAQEWSCSCGYPALQHQNTLACYSFQSRVPKGVSQPSGVNRYMWTHLLRDRGVSGHLVVAESKCVPVTPRFHLAAKLSHTFCISRRVDTSG